MAIIIPIIIHHKLETDIPPSVAVSKDNEEVWSALPGKYDVELVYKYNTYNCTNPEEVKTYF